MKRAFFVLLALVMAGSILFIPAAWAAENSPEAEVTGGLISGTVNEDGSVLIYKGIPYAAPPVGDLRWKSPQPVKPWEGVKECIQYSAAAVQGEQKPFGMWTEEFIIDTSLGYSEDCLYLNVWAPKDAENAPVIMYIHGGGNNSGGASCDVYDGEEIAKKGVVYVSINYRVGIFGFLACTELSAENEDHISGNYAIQDQIAALKWIQENIAALGGDPSNVTVAGQSAGSMNTSMLAVCPEAAGLFKNVVTMSYNPIDSSFVTLHEKEAEGDSVFDGMTLEEMRALSQDEVQALSAKVKAEYNIDNKYVIGNVLDTLRAKRGNDVNIITGNVTGDTTLFGSFFGKFSSRNKAPETVAEYKALVASKTGSLADLFLAAYPAESGEDVARILNESSLDNSVALQIANAKAHAGNGDAKAYVYMFTHGMPGTNPNSTGAFHTADVPYWFNHFSAARADLWTDTDYMVGDIMSDFLVNLAVKGDPNGDSVPVWSAYDSSTKNFCYMEIGDVVEEKTFSDEKTDFWSAYYEELMK